MPHERLAIIPQTDGLSEPHDAQLVTDPAQLLDLLGLPPEMLPAARQAAALFPLRVPLSYVRRMRPGDPDDPLLRQVMGLAGELSSPPDYQSDPLEEADYSPVPGILHKYPGRALLMASGACGVHCRYCFRRHFPYQEHLLSAAQLPEALAWLQSRHDIHEVILSGGDPLVLSPRRLYGLLDELAGIRHIRRLRIHSRQPVVQPAVISDDLVTRLAEYPAQVVMVVHANHANEVDATFAAAMARLRQGGVTLLNQSVLLAGVNDSVEALADLSQALFSTGVLPYYLHLLDRVAGAAHFEVDDGLARRLHQGLQGRMPGYLVPRLVREIPGERSKTLVVPA